MDSKVSWVSGYVCFQEGSVWIQLLHTFYTWLHKNNTCVTQIMMDGKLEPTVLRKTNEEESTRLVSGSDYISHSFAVENI